MTSSRDNKTGLKSIRGRSALPLEFPAGMLTHLINAVAGRVAPRAPSRSLKKLAFPENRMTRRARSDAPYHL